MYVCRYSLHNCEHIKIYIILNTYFLYIIYIIQGVPKKGGFECSESVLRGWKASNQKEEDKRPTLKLI